MSNKMATNSTIGNTSFYQTWWESLGNTGVLVVVSLGLLFFRLWRQRNTRPLPPGPKGHPIFGMTFRSPDERPWLQYEEWAR